MAILIPPSGLRISWATPAAISPSDASFSRWMSRCCVATCSVRSRSTPTAPTMWPPPVEDAAQREVGGERGAARRAAAAICPRPARARRHRALDGLRDAGAVLPAQEVAVAEPRHLLGAPAEQAPPRRVHRDEPAVHVGGEDAVVHALHDRGEQPLAAPHLLLADAQRRCMRLERRPPARSASPVEIVNRSSTMTARPRRRRARRRAAARGGCASRAARAPTARPPPCPRRARADDALRLLLGHVEVDQPLDLRSPTGWRARPARSGPRPASPRRRRPARGRRRPGACRATRTRRRRRSGAGTRTRRGSGCRAR